MSHPQPSGRRAPRLRCVRGGCRSPSLHRRVRCCRGSLDTARVSGADRNKGRPQKLIGDVPSSRTNLAGFGVSSGVYQTIYQTERNKAKLGPAQPASQAGLRHRRTPPGALITRRSRARIPPTRCSQGDPDARSIGWHSPDSALAARSYADGRVRDSKLTAHAGMPPGRDTGCLQRAGTSPPEVTAAASSCH